MTAHCGQLCHIAQPLVNQLAFQSLLLCKLIKQEKMSGLVSVKKEFCGRDNFRNLMKTIHIIIVLVFYAAFRPLHKSGQAHLRLASTCLNSSSEFQTDFTSENGLNYKIA